MRQILLLAAAASLAAGSPARADSAAATIERLGLTGTWASYCATNVDHSKPGLRIVFAAPPDGDPTYTTVSSDGRVTTTVRSSVLEAASDDAGKIRLRLRIIGGDRDGGPLPSPTTESFEQVIEKADNGIMLVAVDPRFIEKCPD